MTISNPLFVRNGAKVIISTSIQPLFETLKKEKTIKVLAKRTGLGNQIQFIPVIEELKKEYEVISDSKVYEQFGILDKVSEEEKADLYITVFHYNHRWFLEELKKYKGKIAGFKYRIKGRSVGFGYYRSMAFNEELSEVENNRLLYNRVFKKDIKEIPFLIPGRDPEKGRIIFSISPKAHKTVPKSSWIELKAMVEKEGFKVYTLDHDIGIAEHIVTPTLKDLQRELGKAEYYIGTDSGVYHLADILGIPSLVVFGSTSILKNGPVNPDSIVLTRNLPCAPCYDWGRVDCKINHLCMHMDAESMFKGFKDLIGKS